MIGVIADDLTGAAELAGIGWRQGLQTRMAHWEAPALPAALLCVDTDSRSVSSEEARRRVRRAASCLQEAGAAWIYKKVDSVLRGHVQVEVQAVLEQLGFRTALIVPANPGRGRVIRGGLYLIHGAPIHTTHFSGDPDYPRRSSRVWDLLGSPTAGTVGVRPVETDPLPSGLVIGEATCSADLCRWTTHRSPAVLLGGAAEFFETLLSTGPETAPTHAREASTEFRLQPVLFVCGSRSEATQSFVAASHGHRVPVFSPPLSDALNSVNGSGADEDLAARVASALHVRGRVVLTSGPDRGATPGRPHPAMEALTGLACRVIRQVSMAHVCVEGGATAAAVLTELGWEHLTPVYEWAPGVVTLETRGRQRLFLTLKPGSYEWPEPLRGSAPVGAAPR
jgi:uncharacterized protein YgbK (DUF1537 family)